MEATVLITLLSSCRTIQKLTTSGQNLVSTLSVYQKLFLLFLILLLLLISFTCSLVHSLPFCPGIAYSVSLPAPPEPNLTCVSTNLPTQIIRSLLSYMPNLNTVLTTFACKHVLPFPLPPSITDLHASHQTNIASTQIVLSTQLPQQMSDSQRNPALLTLGGPYNILLPCLEMWNAVDRACPPFVQFYLLYQAIQCPCGLWCRLYQWSQ